jgi:hypothetical protein
MIFAADVLVQLNYAVAPRIGRRDGGSLKLRL